VPDEDRRSIEAHLEACESCRALYDELAADRRLLGEWDVDAFGRDLWPAIEDRLDETRPVLVRSPWSRAAPIMRVAAAIAIAVGLGHAAGRFSRPGVAPEEAWPAATEEEVAATLGLHVFESPVPAGLYTAVFGVGDAGSGMEVTP
jgi:hypothetical protein